MMTVESGIHTEQQVQIHNSIKLKTQDKQKNTKKNNKKKTNETRGNKSKIENNAKQNTN